MIRPRPLMVQELAAAGAAAMPAILPAPRCRWSAMAMAAATSPGVSSLDAGSSGRSATSAPWVEVAFAFPASALAARARKTLPAIRPVQSFPVEIRDGDIYVDVG